MRGTLIWDKESIINLQVILNEEIVFSFKRLSKSSIKDFLFITRQIIPQVIFGLSKKSQGGIKLCKNKTVQLLKIIMKVAQLLSVFPNDWSGLCKLTQLQ